jgi:putative membrane protein insertion efficiency factor
MTRALATMLQGMIRAYQLTLSPLLGPRCRFAPSCSEYAMEAIGAHGPARGSWLAVRRLARCQPFCDGGYDPVPSCICDVTLRGGTADLSS